MRTVVGDLEAWQATAVSGAERVGARPRHRSCYRTLAGGQGDGRHSRRRDACRRGQKQQLHLPCMQ